MSQTQQRQPKGTETGGQFAASVNPESTVDLGDIHDFIADGPASAGPSPVSVIVPVDESSTNVVERWTFRDMTFGEHQYRVARIQMPSDIVRYSMQNSREGGGWSVEYDQLTCRVKVKGVRPRKPTGWWRDHGEADIRDVINDLEPNAAIIDLNGQMYPVHGGQSWPLGQSQLSGLSTGEMMLTGGKSEDDLRDYVDQQRSDFDKSEAERPDLADSINESRRYVEGIELAADIGAEAARANTVGAMRERGF
jgi:hypothetical protein